MENKKKLFLIINKLIKNAHDKGDNFYGFYKFNEIQKNNKPLITYYGESGCHSPELFINLGNNKVVSSYIRDNKDIVDFIGTFSSEEINYIIKTL